MEVTQKSLVPSTSILGWVWSLVGLEILHPLLDSLREWLIPGQPRLIRPITGFPPGSTPQGLAPRGDSCRAHAAQGRACMSPDRTESHPLRNIMAAFLL